MVFMKPQASNRLLPFALLSTTVIIFVVLSNKGSSVERNSEYNNAAVPARDALTLTKTTFANLDDCAQAIDSESSACKALAKKYIKNFVKWHQSPPGPMCEIMDAGSGWGQHNLCQFDTSDDCKFASFGVSKDWSFDTFMAVNHSCHGVALDPSVIHPSTLVNKGKKVQFYGIGAAMLDEKDVYDKSWQMTSVPSLLRFLKWEKLNVLKMDCEGCEYSIARDVAKEDPDFWTRVDQLALEVHTPIKFMSTSRHTHYLGLLFAQLDFAGFKLQELTFSGCATKVENEGCQKDLVAAGFDCSIKKRGCSNYLFSKV